MRDGLLIRLTDGTSIQYIHTGLLPTNGPLPPLSPNTRCVSLFPGLTNKALIYICQFCDDNYSTVLNAHTVRLVKDDDSTVIGYSNRSNGLWDIALTALTPLSNPPFPQAHVNSA